MRKTITFISLALFISLIIFIKQKQNVNNKRSIIKGPGKVEFICGPTELESSLWELESSLLELEILIEAIKNAENHSDAECGIIHGTVSNVLEKIESMNNLAQSYEDPEIANVINQFLVESELELIKLLISQNEIYCTELINNHKRNSE